LKIKQIVNDAERLSNMTLTSIQAEEVDITTNTLMSCFWRTVTAFWISSKFERWQSVGPTTELRVVGRVGPFKQRP
jgi:hypothetical protein